MAAPRRPEAVPWLLALSLLAGAASAALVVTGRLLPGGVAGALAVVASIFAGWISHHAGQDRLVFADRAAERALEASLFASVAWVAVPEAVWTAAAALVALVMSYLASYLTAKATGLGFEVRERLPYRSGRPILAVVGLLVPAILDFALWAAAAISLEPVVRHGISVARQREPA